MDEIRSLEGRVIGTPNGEPLALSIPDSSMEDCINGIDAFCANIIRYGNRVTRERIQNGEEVSWIFNLDGDEIGRLSVAKKNNSPNGYSFDEIFTANSQSNAGNNDPDAVPGIRLFYDIMDDLNDHLYEYLGYRKPTNRIHPARPKFQSEPGKQTEKSQDDAAKAETVQGNEDIQEPWENQVPSADDRIIIKNLRKGLPASATARSFVIDEKTIYNRESALRKTLGSDIVPFRQEWRKRKALPKREDKKS